MSVTGSIIAGVGAAGAIGGAAISANAAGNAASTQANAAQQGINFNQEVFNAQQANQKPYVAAGQNAVSALDRLMGLPAVPGASNVPFPTAPIKAAAKGGPVTPGRYLVGEKGPEELDLAPGSSGVVIPNNKLNRLAPREQGGPVNAPIADPIYGPTQSMKLPQPIQPLPAPQNPAVPAPANTNQLTPFTNFTPPTAAQAAQYPGYQFVEQQGDQALLNQASAAGTTGSSGTAAALAQYNQELAQTDYQQVYNNAFNTFNSNQTNQFNRLASIAGLGQTGNTQLLNAGNNLGYNVTSGLNNAAAAQASGTIGAANAYGSAFQNIGNSATLPLYLQLLQQNQATSPTGDINSFSGA
jgi:hypothetical protein